MKMKKRAVAAMLAAIMLIGAVGCGTKRTDGTEGTGNGQGGSTADSGDSNELITYEFFSAQANYQGIQPGWYGQILKDKFNIELNIISPNISGGGDTLYQTRTAAGNLGDIVYIENSKMKECVEAGLILDMTPYLEGKENIAKYQLGIDNLTEYIGADGVYAIPLNMSSESPEKPVLFTDKLEVASYMPFDYYQELGSPEIKDTDDLLDVLEQMVANHPETEDGDKTYAFSLYKDWDGGFMSLAGWLASNFGWYFTTESVWTNADATETQLLIDDGSAYYNALKLYFDANQRGLMDPDSSAQSFDDMAAKIQGRQVFYLWWAWMMGYYNTEERGDNGEGYAYIPIGTQKVVTNGFSPYGNGFSIAIGANAEDPERIMEYLDWTCSVEGMNYYCGHIEGLTYEIIDGKQTLTEYGKNAWTDGSTVPEEMGGGSYKEGNCQVNGNIVNKTDTNPETGESYDSGLWETTLAEGRTLLDEQWSEVFGAGSMMDYIEERDMMEVIPASDYTAPAESSELQNMRTQCATLITQTSWQMVFAESEDEFNQLWNEMKEQLPGLGYDEIIKADTAKVEDIREARAETLEAFE